jgi:protein-S-isoprenylcysteine O-methyltransferase Ste14
LVGIEAESDPHEVQVAAAIRMRLLTTRALGVAVAALVLASASSWTVQGPALVGAVLFSAGVLLAVAGFLGRLWALCHIAGRKKCELVTSGPYAMCRHPLYFFSLLGGLGLSLCTERLVITGLFLLTALFLLPLAIRNEDCFLQQRFADFREYQRSVPAFLPRPGLLGEAEAMLIDGRALRRGLLDGGGFLAVLAVVELMEGLQTAGVIPYLFLLP